MLRPWKTMLQINLEDDVAVYQQIADGIIAEIKKGRLKPGTALPGSRILAADIGVNRKTVVLAYEALTAAGWLESAHKKGTFVAAELPEVKQRTATATVNFEFHAHDGFFAAAPAAKRKLITFNDGLPDVRLAPLDELARSYRRIFQQKARWRMMGYGHVQGEERLRIAIADMLAHKRGMNIQPGQLCITRGSQMALYLTARTIIRTGDTVVMECPGYFPAWQTFRDAGADMLPLGVDEKGLKVDELESLCRRRRIKAVYVTPHHQFPTAVTMKMDRRLQLLALSNKYGFAVIEDDYDHEYHFESKSLLPLASHEHAANVIYISSLSKLVAPAVRVGYVAGPPAFIEALSKLRAIIDRQGDTIMEQAIAELMEDGAIARHARRAAAVYRERHALMNQYLQQYLAGKADWRIPEGGLAYWVTFLRKINTEKIARQLLDKGVAVIPTEPFAFDGKPLHALRLGFASLTPRELKEGLRIIGSVIPS
ncbi:PLP-dependent aminotransferase family protein [Chitinophaga solisilvae]|uniref:MocR-like pyridoxine biosynthesis transcription factor PdxR n=1 Tax=Chitinophaga solisilvae TaxID=1233460 RepID=UPI00136BD6E1|nr:PLP-dependent aminotransferase family protein [Chitinophaga solisilvae]